MGNPANTNAFICKKYAPSVPSTNFTCLTRLDQNRAQAQVYIPTYSPFLIIITYVNFSLYNWFVFLPPVQIASKVNVSSGAVKNIIIWGNHSNTQFPDAAHATVTVGGNTLPAYEAVKDDHWLKNEFVKVMRCLLVVR